MPETSALASAPQKPDSWPEDAAPSLRRIGLHQDLPSHDARVLTGGSSVAQIHLDGQVYTLRITRADKLILTK
jgi:hemin uptake protein HemP